MQIHASCGRCGFNRRGLVIKLHQTSISIKQGLRVFVNLGIRILHSYIPEGIANASIKIRQKLKAHHDSLMDLS